MSRAVSTSTPTTIVRLSKIIELVLGRVGLTLNQFRLLSLVEEGTTSSAEVGVRLAMKAPNVSAMINGLIDKGLLLREQDSEDRRRVRLRVTRDGVALMVRADRRCQEALHHVVNDAGASPTLIENLDAWVPVLQSTAADLRKALGEARKP